MAKYSIYAVAIGRDPDTKELVYNKKFKTWPEAQPYVKGVEGARYKGFLTDTEADAWMATVHEKEAAKGHVENPDPISPIQKYVEQQSQQVVTPPKMLEVRPEQLNDAVTIQGEFIAACTMMNLPAHQVMLHLQKQFTETVKLIADFCHDEEESIEESPEEREPHVPEGLDDELPFN